MRFELRRELFHILLGLAIVVLLYFDILNQLILLVMILVVAIGSYIQTKVNLPMVTWFVNRFERPQLRKKFPAYGMLMFFIGCFLVATIFRNHKDIVLASIIILTLGDSISILIGKKFGKIEHPLSRDKLIEGTLSGILVAFLGAMLFVNPIEAIFGSFFALFFEVIELRHVKIDDNITIPLLAAAMIFFIRLL